MKSIGGMCINWKVIAGLAVVGLGVWAVAPGLIRTVAPLLLFAACPLSMLLMMRGMGGMGQTRSAQPQDSADSGLLVRDREEQLATLKARHAAIAREIAALEIKASQPAIVDEPVRDDTGIAVIGR